MDDFSEEYEGSSKVEIKREPQYGCFHNTFADLPKAAVLVISSNTHLLLIKNVVGKTIMDIICMDIVLHGYLRLKSQGLHLVLSVFKLAIFSVILIKVLLTIKI